MNRRRRPDELFEPRIAAWLESDPILAPVGLTDEILARVRSTGQPLRDGDWLARRRSLFTPVAIVLLLLLALVTAVVGSRRLADVSLVPGPTGPVDVGRNVIAIGAPEAVVLIDSGDGAEIATIPLDYSTAADPPWPHDLSWAPDGRRLAIAAFDGIWVLDTGSGRSEKIRRCGTGPTACTVAWSPDGSRIAVANGSQLQLLDPDGSDELDLPASHATIEHPTWSPDGRWIAFTAIEAAGEPRRLRVIEREGGNEHEIAPAVPGSAVWDPGWAPDGSAIAYVAMAEERCPPAERACRPLGLTLAVVAPDGSGARTIRDLGRCFCVGALPGLDWSPAGGELAVIRPGQDGGAGELIAVRADGSDARRVFAPAGGGPAWRP